ncbi:hypothetical protein [Streptomyces erythrochromogenes]|uniref:hypothetical protein n=1 Tax=Streptomyces erythrochromogenes TaxID=285574 RepID=UPI0036CE725D
MADRIHRRHPSNKETAAHQRHALVALLAADALLCKDPATSTRRLSFDRHSPRP